MAFPSEFLYLMIAGVAHNFTVKFVCMDAYDDLKMLINLFLF